MRLSVFLIALFLANFAAEVAVADQIDVWLGTSGSKLSRGIYHCILNTETGDLSDPKVAAEIKGPGFLAMHPSKPVLYAVGTLEGEPSVVAYQMSGKLKNATLSLLNSCPIGDGGAAHVAVDRTGTTLLTAQYGGGSTAAYLLNVDGSISKQTQLIDHEGGSKVVPRRQDKPHAHWCGFSADQKYAFVPDLGMDAVVVYTCDVKNAQLSHSGNVALPGGAGPRHMKFHTNGKWAYVLHELDLKVSVFDYAPAAGSMNLKQTIETVPRDELAKEKFKSCSEIRVHPNGKFVYAANRGHDTITVFRVNESNGTLTFVERENVRGAFPRNFNISPDGKWILVGGQKSHTLSCFEIDQESGELTFNQNVVHAPSCICVLFQHE